MKKVFYHYKKWEDHKHGMFRTTCENEEQKVQSCVDLLCNLPALNEYMRIVSTEWKYSSEINLSNRSRNRQAWLGQAACCKYCEAPEYVTKKAWKLLTDEQREKANFVADRIISEWESSYTPHT